MQRRGLPDLELRRPGDKESPELRRQNPRIQVGEHHEGQFTDLSRHVSTSFN
jgi:hypothetical protein